MFFGTGLGDARRAGEHLGDSLDPATTPELRNHNG
jgi:hypothetical protein